jgi:hypothetical protein
MDTTGRVGTIVTITAIVTMATTMAIAVIGERHRNAVAIWSFAIK